MAGFRPFAIGIGVLGLSCAQGGGAPEALPPPTTTAPPAAQALCNGAFSDGTSINVANPVYLADVPGTQQFCDFHTFAWNQFLYVTNGTPAFLSMAPWYNLLQASGPPPPPAYPGGSTALQGGKLDKQQAGDADQLLDVAGAAVLYDIRVNQTYYDSLVSQNLYTYALYSAACAPDSNSNCTNLLWLPPNAGTAGGAMEIKTAWRDFKTAAACPASTYYCVGRLGLVGLHLVQKTATHGEWIWASFEHAGNAPDCAPGSDSPIGALSPAGSPWSFFNPKTVPPSVMSTQTCSVVAPAVCNPTPRTASGFAAVNICRTDSIPAGGASAANCAVKSAPHLPNDQANNGGNVACLNATFQPQRSGVWKNYKLVGTLWTRGTMKPTQDFRIQVFQTQVPNLPYVEAVGFPHLANTTMETFLQDGSTGYDPFKTNATTAGCFECHNLPSQANPQFGQLDLSHVVSKFDELKVPRVKAQ
jgi:hypothetical protein